MKKYATLLLVFGFIFSTSVGLASAQTITLPDMPKGVRPQGGIEDKQKLMEERREALKENREARRADASTMTEEEKEALKEKSEAIREELQKKREALRDQAEKLREEAKKKMEALKAKIKDTASLKRYEGRENALHRFDNQVEKVMELRDKVNTKIAELTAKGVDTTTAKTHVANADIKFEEAKKKIAEMNVIFAGSTNQLSEANKTKLQTLAKEAGTLLKDAYNELKLAVKSLKEAVQPNTQNTTSTQ
ncbi:MAG: hypothetical protein ACK4FA_00755 [Candidatus Paceibacteria bacterium]